MIHSSLQTIGELPFLEKSVQAALVYAQTHDLLQYETGTYEIDGENLFVNVVEYETTAVENRIWEAHRAYLDLHFMLRGEEQIDIGFIQNMQEKPYVAEEDFLPLDGEKSASVYLKEGDFLLCYPHDAHRTAVAIGAPQKIKKAIFKIKIQK